MSLVIGGLGIIAMTVLGFFICSSGEYSCQVIRGFSLFVGFIGLSFAVAGAYIWIDDKRKGRRTRTETTEPPAV